ncbi:MAG TPA: hypothetical protein P5572_21175, partial [Phycisphaerae bacterium]|nr:hypothetical protein [Phycisphaerae bacterium]
TALAEYCDNDGCGTPQGPARLVVDASPGDTFLVRIGGYDGAVGGGQLIVLPIEAGHGACCLPDGGCAIMAMASCASAGGAFHEKADCFNIEETCGVVGACCQGTDGCAEVSESLCAARGGVFLGEGASCGSPADCDGDGETDFCVFYLGAPDCNANGIPDACDIDPIVGTTSDCNGNLIPDECDDLPVCCPGDPNHDGVIDATDAGLLAAALLSTPSTCLDTAFCRVDANGDHTLDGRDIAGFVNALTNQSLCPPVLMVTVRVIPPGTSARDNQVFVFDETGRFVRQFPQIEPARSDSFGYRDGATDGTYVYFGWGDGVARHNLDGSGGVQIIFGPVPGTGAVWRALAYDPTGDGGNGSLWTESFNSDLVETDLQGNLLHQFPNNGAVLYGLAYDETTGKLWGHHQSSPTGSAAVVEIDPETGTMTGVSFPSHFNQAGGSLDGLALHGGLSMDDATHTLFGVLQAQADALFSVDTTGTLVPPLDPNPRGDIEYQTGSNVALGITVVRP